MIKRSILIGLLVGAALIVVAAYPFLAIYIGPRVLRESWPLIPDPFRSLMLIFTGGLGLIILSLVGSLAAWKTGATDVKSGFKAGAISGLVVGVMFYLLLVAPTSAAISSARLWTHLPTRQAPYPTEELILSYVRQMTLRMHISMDLVFLSMALLGGLEGAIVGKLRKRGPAPRPSLLDVMSKPQPRRRWWAHQDETWRAGIIAGLIVGVIIWLSVTAAFFTNLEVEWPALDLAMLRQTNLVTRVLFSDVLQNCLFPLLVLAIVGTGALAVLLLKDPPRRHLSRFNVVLIAGVAASVPITAAATNIAHFGLGISRYLAWNFAQHATIDDLTSAYYIDPESLEFLRGFVHSPEVSLPFFYILPIALFVLILIGTLLWLAPQAAFYGLTLPLIFRRPVDRAARFARHLQNQPASLLPNLYRLYANDARAVQVLPHLAFQLKDPAQADVVAAFHNLSAEADRTERTVGVIRRAIAERPDWRWRAEVGELYRILDEGLTAKTLAQVTAIEPPPEEITSSLPLILARGCEGIGRILAELKKVERVDDLSTKLIFLNSAQAALLDLRRATEHESKECQHCETPYPETAILYSLMDYWQGFVLTASQDLQGRADLRAELAAPRAGFGPKVRQCVVVTNQGLNVAQNIRLCVADGEGYEVVEGAEQGIEILGPQESRELEFWLAPDAPRRLRLNWDLIFDDAVDMGRQVEFADAMELEEERGEQPFQRIFPIPYVTGTPLRSDEMFVGRQDVFEFVQEHLLGAYQNNVIVLHGQRRTGKTSILYRLQEVLADTHVTVLVDMQGKAARGAADFLYALSDDIVYALENHSIFVDLPERREYEEAPEFTFRSRFLRSVVKDLDSRNLFLMFDEFEELQKRVKDGRLEPEIFPFLRNLMQHEPRLDFLFSGTHKLEELGAEYWSILFNIAAYKRITFLDAKEVQRLVTEPVAAFGMEYDPLAVERIMQVTAGHPYFTQVVCHEMVAYHNETERNYLSVTHVDMVLERIIERGEAHFKYIWAGATPDEHKVMLALTDLLPDADATTTPGQVAEELERKGYELSEEDLTRALAHLQAKDIVTRSGPQSSLYRFKIDLIRRWIGITRPAL